MAEIYEAEISTSCLVAALEGLSGMPEAAPVVEQIAVITKIARQTSEIHRSDRQCPAPARKRQQLTLPPKAVPQRPSFSNVMCFYKKYM
jgi:hypothetical protein